MNRLWDEERARKVIEWEHEKRGGKMKKSGEKERNQLEFVSNKSKERVIV